MNSKLVEKIIAGTAGGIAGFLIGRILALAGVPWQWIAVIVLIATVMLGLFIGLFIHRRR